MTAGEPMNPEPNVAIQFLQSFLQAHYNDYRLNGGKHGPYIVWNDLGPEVGARLLANYEASEVAG